MSQIAFGNCVDEFTPRPDLQATFSAPVIQMPDSGALCDNRSKKASSVVQVNQAFTDEYGLANPRRGVLSDKYNTMEGSVKVPRHDPDTHFVPSCAMINGVTFVQDTRLQAHPARFFR